MATIIALSPPSSIANGYTTDPFTLLVQGDPMSGTAVFTPASSQPGTFSPSSVTLGPLITSATFAYTPASATPPVISITNDSGFANPASVNYGPLGSVGLGTGQVSLTAPDFTVAEDAGSGYAYVARTDGSTGAASVTVTSSDGSATAGSDYTTISTVLNWTDGESGSKPVGVPILLNSSNTAPEFLTLTLSGATGVTIGQQSTATVTIVQAGMAGGASASLDAVIAGKPWREWIELQLAQQFGNSSGHGTASERYSSVDGSKTRVTKVVDNKGNTLASVLDGS